MNLDYKENLWLLNNFSKCRCCFENFNHNEEQVEITEIIKDQFLDLTQIELLASPNYSNIVCMKCTNELQSISCFRLDLISKQQQLYECVITSQYQIQDVIIEPVNIETETQTCNEFVILNSENEEIENPEVPISQATKTKKQSPKKGSIKHNLKTQKPKDVTKVQKKEAESKRQCSECKKIFYNSGNLAIHTRRVHLNIKQFFCDLCGFGLLFKGEMEAHMKTHLPKKYREKHYCDQCEYSSTWSDKMKKHLNNCDHRSLNKKKVRSECHCGQVFQSIKALYVHKRNTHDKQLNHICKICEKGFVSQFALTRHMGTHRKRKFCCDFCGKMFATLRDLRVHLIYHKEPKFICNFDGCSKKYFASNKFESHKKTHIDQRDFACQLCDKKFSEFSNLKRHDLLVHKKLKFS